MSVPGRSRRPLLAWAVAAATCAVAACPTWADPPSSSFTRVPVCGDQDDFTAQLKCADLVPLPDIEVFRVPGTGVVDLTFDFVFSEVTLPNELGFFRVDDLNGRVGDLSPAEPGYLAAALAGAHVIFPLGSDAFVPDASIRVAGGDMLAFFIVHGDTLASFVASNLENDLDKLPNAFFSLTSLNPDPQTSFGGDHFVSFESPSSALTQFAFEDVSAFSDWDFDDVVFNVSARLERPTCEGPDGDGDGVVDACDTCPALADPEQRDADRDLVGDGCDNCPRAPNLGQGDADGDGRGDACSLEACSDGRDNDGNGLADGDDLGCPSFRIAKLAQPLAGARIGARVKVKGKGFGRSPGTLEVAGQEVSVKSWRAKKVTFAVPPLPAGVYPVRLLRGSDRSDREDLFVPDLPRLGRKATLRALADLLGGTSWWTYYDDVLRREKKLANPFWLHEALRENGPGETDFVVTAIAAIDATTYGGSTEQRSAAARAFRDCQQHYLSQIPSALLDQYLSCTGYPGTKERLRALPVDVQLRILNAGRPAGRNQCFVASGYYQECRDALQAAGIGDAALATLGF